MTAFGLYELDDEGEGNGVVHWFCSATCRDASPLDMPEGCDVAPEGSLCETCGAEL